MATSRGYPIIANTNSVRVPQDMNALAQAVNDDVAGVVTSLLAARAVADNALANAALYNSAPVGRIGLAGAQQVASSSNDVGVVLQLTQNLLPNAGGVRRSGQNTRLFAPRDGYYNIPLSVSFDPIASGSTPQGIRAVEIRVNAMASGTGGYRAGLRQIARPSQVDGRCLITYSVPIVLAEGDSIELFVIQNQGVGIPISSNTEMSMYWLRPSS